ncbi:metallophosphoesterase family protein [Undibacterium rugosum]|uniref:Metallophosphoesterase n=1 Tax=Undibacterium rugosum TaxID=2762291 RepID=A0A923I3H4_9BURK|nr:metallophosphoesterase [Undibacterium rugosum]MBC3935665.1 metallophosphoesterase [Undibacterium rugosum]MBR7778572.1 metallophosphoesterase [Undibacterium rugosum]
MRLYYLLPLLSSLLLSTSLHANEQTSQVAQIRKPQKLKNPLTLYIAGDIADCRKQPAGETMAARTSDLILAALEKDSNAYALTLGDNTYPIGKPEEFSNCYDPTWGRFKERTLPSPGNHDYGQPKALGYYNYFGDIAGPERRGYYSKRIGQWHLLSLNSNLSGSQMQKQIEWLREELSSNQKLCTLAFWHHPAYSSGGHGNNSFMQPVWKMLADAKADIVLTSHDHDYERFAPMNGNGDRDEQGGIRSFVVGTGGAKLTPMFFPKGTTEIRDNNTHGVLKLVLHEKSYEWEFISIGDSNFSDKGKGSCH